MSEKIVLGVTGMPGAGKATVRRMVEERGYPAVVMGDEIRLEAERRGLKPTPANLGELMLELRKEKGPAIVARRCTLKIEQAKAELVLVDGVRSLNEVMEFRKHFSNFFLIAVHASPETRFQRLFRRGRSDDPKDWETFRQRDSRELSVGLGSVIATAQYMIVNEGTKSQLKKRVREVLEEVIEDG